MSDERTKRLRTALVMSGAATLAAWVGLAELTQTHNAFEVLSVALISAAFGGFAGFIAGLGIPILRERDTPDRTPAGLSLLLLGILLWLGSACMIPFAAIYNLHYR